MEGALGGGAGPVDGHLEAVEFFVCQIIGRRDFEVGATAETPGGVDDFAGEGLFERRFCREFDEISGFELIKDVLLFGTNEISNRKEAESGCVLRNPGFTFDRDRAVGPFGVLPSGQDLSGGRHGSVILAQASSGVCVSHSKQWHKSLSLDVTRDEKGLEWRESRHLPPQAAHP